MTKGSKKILVVDDSETSLYLMRAIFEDDPNIDVLTEKDSRCTLRAIDEDTPDLLMLDIMMPNLNGLDLLDKIKANQKFDDIPIVMVSANHDPYLIEKAFQYKSVKDYIKKPITLEGLKLRVKEILSFID